MEKTEPQAEPRLEYQRDEHHVHLIVYHLIWCPRRRKPLLVGKVKERCQQLIEAKCKDQAWLLLALAIQPDHIHIFVRVRPSHSRAKYQGNFGTSLVVGDMAPPTGMRYAPHACVARRQLREAATL